MNTGQPAGHPGGPAYILRLFVTGSTARSTAAISNLRRICEDRLHGEYHLEIIDLYQHPQAAKSNQIIAAPTLLKVLPLPLRRIIGDLANEERVLAGLDLAPRATPHTGV